MAKRKTQKPTTVTKSTIRRAIQTLDKVGGEMESAVLRFVLEVAEAIRTELYKDDDGNKRSMKWIQTNIVPGHIDNWSDEGLMRCIKGAVGIAAGWRYTFDQFLNIDGLKPRMFHLCRPFTATDAQWNKDGRPNKAEVTKWLQGKHGHQSSDVQARQGKIKPKDQPSSNDDTDSTPAIVTLANGVSAVRADNGKTVDGPTLITNTLALVDLMDDQTQISLYETLRGYKAIVAERERRAKQATPKAKAAVRKRKPAKRSRKVA